MVVDVFFLCRVRMRHRCLSWRWSSFLLRLLYCVSICRCSLSSIEYWINCQLLCYVEAHSKWISYSRSLSFCFLIYRNLSSWFKRWCVAAFIVLRHWRLLPFTLTDIYFGSSCLRLYDFYYTISLH